MLWVFAFLLETIVVLQPIRLSVLLVAIVCFQVPDILGVYVAAGCF